MIGDVIQPDLEILLEKRDVKRLREVLAELDPSDIAELIKDLPPEMGGMIFRVQTRRRASEVFSQLDPDVQENLVKALSADQTSELIQGMDPDDRVALLDELPSEVALRLMASMPMSKRRETALLLGYPEESAGRFMTPDFFSLPSSLTVSGALKRIREYRGPAETFNIIYVIDEEGRPLRDIGLSTLVRSGARRRIGSIKERPLVTIPASMDRELVVEEFKHYDRLALPVVDSRGKMIGIVTHDDIMDVAEEEFTEDIHKLGGTEALEDAYAETPFFTMLRKRGGWLSLLFVGELMTIWAMHRFEGELSHAVLLAMFVPLIISSGGNSGSQATTLVIRAMALSEIELKDWFKVLGREISAGFVLGAWLGLLGLARVVMWDHLGWVDYSGHAWKVGAAVAISLVGVVTFGTFTGSMLPFALKRLGFDPATSSAPVVATLVDVTGLLIYFTVALLLLKGSLL